MPEQRDDEEALSQTGQHRAYRYPPSFHERRENDERIRDLEEKIARLEEKVNPVATWFSKMTATGQTLGSLRGIAQWILIIVALVAAAKVGFLNWLGIGKGGPP